MKDNFGYLRTVVTRFDKGSAHAEKPDKSYVKAVVQHQFRPGSAPTLTSFQEYHAGLMRSVQGKLNEDANSVPQLELSSSAWSSENSPIKRMCLKRQDLISISSVLHFYYTILKVQIIA